MCGRDSRRMLSAGIWRISLCLHHCFVPSPVPLRRGGAGAAAHRDEGGGDPQSTPLNMQMFYCDPPDLEDIICFGECLGGERLLAL